MKSKATLAHSFATLATLALIISSTAACSDDSAIGDMSFDSTEDGVVSRLFGTITNFFTSKAAEDKPVSPHEPWSMPAGYEDPAVDELFDAMGLEEVNPASGDGSIDGALVGLFEHFPDPNDPEDYYDEVCFFANSPDQLPSEETLFWAEMYGFRSNNGEVSDINGIAIDQECVWCEEGNTGGGETRVIFYVNGIKTDHDTHCDTLQAIANKTGAVTVGVLNETEGTLKDVWQTAWDRFSVAIEKKLAKYGVENITKIHNNKAAVMMQNLIIQRVRAGKHVEIWAHSQGGAVTALALHRALRVLKAEGLFPVEVDGEVNTKAIQVVTFGSAAPQWPFGAFPKGPKYTHFVHLRDATPSALGVGAWGGYTSLGETRAGDDAKMIFFDGEPLGPEEDPPTEKVDRFSEIASNMADVGFTDLSGTKYHDVFRTYLEMYEQKNGAWNY